MRNADRLLGIIYRGCRLEKLLKELKLFARDEFHGEMACRNTKFLKAVSTAYTRKYPDNYTLEEIENTLKIYLGYGNKYLCGGDNACGLFFYCAEELFLVRQETLLVKFDELLEWDGFCNKIDANILIAAFSSLHPKVDVAKTDAVVRHDNHALERILGKGAADNHMHLKASGYSAAMSWAALMLCSFYEDKTLLNFIHKTRMIEQGFALDEHSALMILKKIKLIRLFFEEYLCVHKIHISSMIAHSVTKVGSGINTPTKIQMARYLASENDTWCYSEKRWIEKNLPLIEGGYSKAKGIRKFIVAERLFLKEMFLWARSCRDNFLLHLFNIYLAALSQIRFYFVQDNEGMGFKKFKLREDVKEDLLSLHTYSSREIVQMDDVYLSVFDRCYQTKIIKYAEFRIAPRKDAELITLFRKLDRANEIIYHLHPGTKKICYGVIIHFIKEEHQSELQKGAYRWEALRDKYNKQTLQLLNYLNKRLLLSEKIVGIDAANYETQCRPEVLAPYFRRIRCTVGSSREIGMTYHVGEAFDALCSGLRAIDEAIVFMNLRRGDRLGHALALGVEVDAFQKVKRGMVDLSLQNHVDNLAWLYHVLSYYGRVEDKRYLGYLDEEFHRHCSKLYGGTNVGEIHILDYIDAWKLRGDAPDLYRETNLLNKFINNYSVFAFDKDYMINRAEYQHRSAFLNEKARTLYIKYLFNVKQFQNGERLIHVQLNKEYWEAVKIAQQLLREKVYKLEIAIETNPSSNRKISYIRHLVELPLLTFNSHHLHSLKKRTGEDLPVSINTDDGDIFQTDLANEYALVVAALQREGVDNQDIYDYIDYLREASLLQTFVHE